MKWREIILNKQAVSSDLLLVGGQKVEQTKSAKQTEFDLLS